MVYTIDGTEPTAESTVYSAPIEFTESGILKIRSVLPSGKMSKTRTITVEKQALAPAKEVAKTTPGLEMQVTDGMFLESSKLADVKEWKKSTMKDLRELTSVVKTSESMRGVKQYAAVATGYVNIPDVYKRQVQSQVLTHNGETYQSDICFFHVLFYFIFRYFINANKSFNDSLIEGCV